MTPPKLDTIAILPTERQLSRVRFSADGRWLWAAGRDGLVHRWDLSRPVEAGATTPPAAGAPAKPPAPSFAEAAPLAGHDGWVSALALAREPARGFSGDTWGRLIAWRIDGEAPAILWNNPRAHDGWIRQIAVSPRGDRIATCGMDRAVRLWSAADGKLEREWAPGPDDVFSVAFHPDGSALLTGDLKGVVRQWTLPDAGPAGEFDARSLYLLSNIQDVGGVRVIEFAPEGRTFAVAGAQPAGGGFVEAVPVLKLFDWTTRAETQSLALGEKTEGFVHDLAFHPEGSWIGVTSGQPGRGGVFVQRPGEPQPVLRHPLPNCHSVAVAPDGRRIAVLANAGTYGQQKSMAREGVYPGNTSPIHLFELVPGQA
jgi:WD40 repeat protein